jgi:hypothetical protein
MRFTGSKNLGDSVSLLHALPSVLVTFHIHDHRCIGAYLAFRSTKKAGK